MKNSKKNLSIAGQSTTEVNKPQKHDANLQKNSTLYFQIGLILCLLGTYSLFEMKFQDKKLVVETVEIDETAMIDIVPTFIEEVVKIEKQKIERSTELIDKYEEVEDDDPKKVETEIITPEERKPEFKPVEIGSIPEADDPEDEDVIVPFVRIEKVPVYPGCEKKITNDAKRKCMSDKISKLVNRKFNTEIANDYGISGRQRIYTQFTIDKNGDVVDVKIRGPHPALEKEAKRLINKIPKMQPGLQRNEPVGVIYTLPIVFDAIN